ncbi:DUF2911 domain-containing protein [Dyadobacter frigoris]|uniref:DUF2911 domain-containing protein n=1 Tax=Dyadobacter frigoris TaxID=2576211 RepID=A0A4U6D2S6_9BACT|nr:DUF2911 domain-containing protein [Dyadobacter frigoris]TKT91560.1 DUF2911 domain-containing protein [Dyadobacter frigoris]GLU51881.1 hypothetical protein Dfri01_13420 [Dyadobacter frigoris]
MKKYLLSLTFAIAVASASLAQRTPQASPGATIIQTVGITDFTVKYSRPAIKGRAVFADKSPIAPTGQLWRTGANQPTIFESTTDFTFGDKKVPAGKYVLFSIPEKAKWTVILNKNLNANTDVYKETEDVARIDAIPVSGESTESFEISFSDITDSTTLMNIAWGTVKVPVKLFLATQELTIASLDRAVQDKPEDVATLQSAAGYFLSKNIDLRKALSLADKAIGLKEGWSNLWIKAQILDKMGKASEALPIAQKALTVGAASPDGAYDFYKTQIAKGITDMQAKAPAKEVNSKSKKKKK